MTNTSKPIIDAEFEIVHDPNKRNKRPEVGSVAQVIDSAMDAGIIACIRSLNNAKEMEARNSQNEHTMKVLCDLGVVFDCLLDRNNYEKP